jgi:DNA-binding GntR family transcriptional regulator
MTAGKFEAISSQARTYELVLERLRDAIIDGTIRPGEHIKTADIAREMGVSRMPVREALHRLEVEGLVLMQPYRGIIAAPLSVDGVRDAYELLSVIEGLAANKAAESITEEGCADLDLILEQMDQALTAKDYESYFRGNRRFHSEICDWYDNERAHEILVHLWNYVHRLRLVYIPSAARFAEARREHKAIVEALRQRNSTAEELLRRHSENAGAEILRQVRAHPLEQAT